MSYNLTFKTYKEIIDYLATVDYPQCFTVNYRPKEKDYELWIGNQPYCMYERWIEEEEHKVMELKKENSILKLKIKNNSMEEVVDKENWYKSMLELKKKESQLFERKWIEYRNFLLNIHFTLHDENSLKREIEEFTKDDIKWKE